MINELKGSGSMSDQTSLEPDLLKKERGVSGSMSESTSLEDIKSLEELESEIQAYKKLISQMEASGGEIDIKELEEARDRIRALEQEKKSRDNTIKY